VLLASLLGSVIVAASAISNRVTPRASASEAQVPTAFVDALVCAPDRGSVSAVFVLPGLNATGLQRVDQVWIDLSLFNNNFAAGTFIGAGSFALRPDDGYLSGWTGLSVGRGHYYRLNALVDGRWIELGRGSFETPLCGLVRTIACPFNVKGAPPNELAFATFAVPGGSVSPDGPNPREGWLDLSLFNNGFRLGTFLGAGPFHPVANTEFQWEGLVTARRHFVRVNTLHDNGLWIPRINDSFVTLECRGRPTVTPPAI
jgi:hypothetical protein